MEWNDLVRMGTASVLLAASWFAIGCGDNTPPTQDHRRNVMIVDDGFDPTLPVFAGKIVATYTADCPAGSASGDDAGAPGPADGGTPDAGSSFDEAKAALIAELAVADDSCSLRAELTPAPNPFADLEADRSAFNTAIRGDVLAGNPFKSSPYDATFAAITDRLATASFHGTATSGIVATDDPAVRLVLVQRSLLTPDQVMSDFSCIQPQEIADTVALLSDGDVRDAYLQRPLPTLDRDLADARARHGIGLVNESFGRISRFRLESLLADALCPAVDLKGYFEVLGGLEAAYAQAHLEPEVLVLQAAGNDASLVNGLVDNLDCLPDDPYHLLVGSYGPGGARSYFTNFGDCVEVYAPGQDVIVPLPGDWLLPLSGTSFSTPLIVRLLSLTAKVPFDPPAAHAALVALREPNRNILARNFPSDLLYDPSTTAYRSALTTGAAAPAGQAATRPVAEPIDSAALRRILWPLRWTRRHLRNR